MPEFSGYPPGTPSWVDLGSPDVDASARFYGDLFGWDTTEPGPVEETGGYRMFLQRGKMVAGLGPLMQEGQPPAWTTYVATDSADDTAAKVDAAGGQVFMPPFDVMDAGRMTVLADPAGAVFGVWQAGRHRGAELANEPGSLCWNELLTRDVDGAKRFYNAVFGWEGATDPGSGAAEFTEWKLDGRTIGGMSNMADRLPPEVPPHWGVVFAVEDTDAAASRARELGATVQVEPTDIPVGRFAVLADPQGATFTVIALAGERPAA